MESLPFGMNHLTEEMVRKARDELHETEDTRREGLIRMKQLISEHPDLQDCRTDDEFLIKFLRARKFHAKRATELLVNFHTLHKKFQIAYSEASYEEFKKTLRNGLITILPQRDENGCAILYMNFEDWNIEEKSVPALVLDFMFGVLLCVELPASQVCGIRILYNCTGMSWALLPRFPLSMIFLIAKCYTNCLPVRLKSFEMVYEPPVVIYIWQILKYLLPTKIRSRNRFHSQNLDRLYEQIPPHLLPTRFGGNVQLDAGFIHQQFPNLEELYQGYMVIEAISSI